MENIDIGFAKCQNRRHFCRLVFGGASALILSACGGGGEDSDDSRNLRAALDRLQPGMTEDEVLAAVGWPPNDAGAWDNGEEYLRVTVNLIDGALIITGANYFKGSENISRAYI